MKYKDISSVNLSNLTVSERNTRNFHFLFKYTYSLDIRSVTPRSNINLNFFFGNVIVLHHDSNYLKEIWFTIPIFSNKQYTVYSLLVSRNPQILLELFFTNNTHTKFQLAISICFRVINILSRWCLTNKHPVYPLNVNVSGTAFAGSSNAIC